MNIFFLDTDIKKSAQYHCDKHVVKMILEQNQILCSVIYRNSGILSKKDYLNNLPELETKYESFPRRKDDGSVSLYGIGFIHHGCTTWTSKSKANFDWVIEHNLALCDEYNYRYGKHHSGKKITEWVKSLNFDKFDSTEFTFPYLAMPDEVKIENDYVASYRNYYINNKKGFATWKIREIPDWWENE